MRLTGRFDLEEAAPFIRIAAAATGDVFVTGTLTQAADFGDEGRQSPESATNTFVTRLSPQGEVRWATVLGGASTALPTDITEGTDGGALVVGHFTGTGHFGELPLATAGTTDGFVAHLDRVGDVGWARSFKGDGNVHIRATAAAPSGDFFLVGTATGSLEGLGCEVGTSSTEDVFVVRLSADGASIRWCRRFDNPGEELAIAAASSASAIFVAGTFTLLASFGGEELVGSGNGFVFALEAQEGEHLWSVALESNSSVAVGGLAFSPTGEVIVTGGFGGTWGDLQIGDWTHPGGALTFAPFAAALDASSGGFRWADAGLRIATTTTGTAVVARADGTADWLVVPVDPALRTVQDGALLAQERLDFIAHDLALDASGRLVLGMDFGGSRVGAMSHPSTGDYDDFGLVYVLE